jgi:hypothetical protein
MSNPPGPVARLTGLDVLAASLEGMAEDKQEQIIIAALPLRSRPGLYIDPSPRADSALLILEEPSDPEDYGADAIIGLAVPDGNGGWYLGCTECHGEIAEEDSGMCQPCRQDAAWHDEQDRAACEPTR